MSFKLIIVEFLLLVSVLRTAMTALPPGVTPCAITEDKSAYHKCVLEQIEALRPYLAKGIASLKLPAMEPLLLPSLTIDRNLEALKIRANMTQVRVYGVSGFVVEDMKADPRGLSADLKISIPQIHVNGNYDVQGRLLLLPLNGAGSFKGNFSNTHVHVIAKGKEVADKNGVQRIEVSEIAIKIRVGDGNIKLKAPPRNALAADAAATFFNSNPRLVLDISSPIIEDTAVTISKALAARALGALTKKELLL